jgi:hypothetical protein
MHIVELEILITENVLNFINESILGNFTGVFNGFEVNNVALDGTFDLSIRVYGVWVDLTGFAIDPEDDEIVVADNDFDYVKGDRARKLFVIKILEKLAERLSVCEGRINND